MQQQHIRCVPTPDLPLNLTELVQLLGQHQHTSTNTQSAGDPETYQQACAALARLIRHDCQTLRAQVTSEFRAFDHIMAQELGVTPTATSQAPMADAASEQVFLSHLLSLLLLARYRPLTDAEEDAALRDSFTLTAPITIQYDKLDPTLLTTFWGGSAQRREARALLPPSADRVLVFHRGVGRATAEGVYLPDKLNLLLRHMARPLWASARRWLDPSYVSRLEARLAGVANTEVDGDDKQLVVSCPPLTVERRSLVVLAPSAGAVLWQLGAVMGLQEPTFKQVVVLYRNATNADAEDEDPTVVPPYVQECLPVEVSGVITEIHNSLSSEDANEQQQQQQSLSPVQIAKQLPVRVAHQVRQSVGQTQQKVKAQVKSSVSRSLQLLKGAPQVEGREVPEERRLKLGLFTSVPLADLELVLPHKQVYPHPVRIVQLVFTAATALLGALAATWQTVANRPPVPPGTPGLVQKAADPTAAAVLSTAVSGAVQAVEHELAQVPALLLALSGVLLLRAGQMYFSIKRSTQPLLQNMKLQAAKKQLGRQAAVISAVVDQVQAALLQEATLCWSLLLAAGQPLSLAEVSRAAGQLLSDACGYPVVLDLAPAARRLVQLGLVEVSNTAAPAPAPAPAAAAGGGGGEEGEGDAPGVASSAAATGGDNCADPAGRVGSSDQVLERQAGTWLPSQVLLTAVPVDRALQVLAAHWQQRQQQEVTAAAAGQDVLGQQLGEVASPEVWEWVEQEAQLALADMGVAHSFTDGSPRGGRRSSSPGGVGAASSSIMPEQQGPAVGSVVPAHPHKGLLPRAGSSRTPGRRVVARAAPMLPGSVRRQQTGRLLCCRRGAPAAAAAWR